MGTIDNIRSGFDITPSGGGRKKASKRQEQQINISDEVSISSGGASRLDSVIPSSIPGVRPAKFSGKAVSDTVSRITALARGLGGNFNMEVSEGDGWSYDFISNSMTYSKKDVANKPAEYAVGAILHEVSHRRYSEWLIEPQMQNNEAFINLCNAVEDPRVNNITTSRYEGAKDFFKTVYDEDFFNGGNERDMKEQIVEQLRLSGVPEEEAVKTAEKSFNGSIPRHNQFGMGIIYDWYTNGKMDPSIKDEDVKKAIKQAAPFFREAISLKRDVMMKDLTPEEVHSQAQQSYDITKEKIWPIAQKLYEMDKKDLEKQLQQQPQQPQQGQQSGQSKPGQGQSKPGQSHSKPGQGQQSGQPKPGQGQQSGQPKPGQNGGMSPEKAKETAEKVLENLDKALSDSKFEEKDKSARRQNRADKGSESGGKPGQMKDANEANGSGKADSGKPEQADKKDGKGADKADSQSGNPDNQGQGASGKGTTSDIDLPSIEDLIQKKLEIEARNEAMQSSYDRYVYDTAVFSDEMAGEMKNFIQEQERPKFVGNFSSGKKLNIRAAMQAETKYQLTGEFDSDIWLRRTNPTKRDHQFMFVLDESGSMRDSEKWENALSGLVLCQEALSSLEMDFGVVGFSNKPRIHKSLEDKFDEDFKNKEMAQIENSEKGGTNDADAIETALEMLKNQDSSKQKTIIVITDGEGKIDKVKKLVEEGDEAGVRIIGVGIGDGMASVGDAYRYSVKVDNLAQLPMKLSDLVREQVENSYSD